MQGCTKSTPNAKQLAVRITLGVAFYECFSLHNFSIPVLPRSGALVLKFVVIIVTIWCGEEGVEPGAENVVRLAVREPQEVLLLVALVLLLIPGTVLLRRCGALVHDDFGEGQLLLGHLKHSLLHSGTHDEAVDEDVF